MLFLFAAAFALRLLHVLAMRASPYFANPVIDAATYDDIARSITAGRGYPEAIFWQPPGYPYFLSWVYALCGPGYMAPRIVQALLGAAGAALTAWIGARFFGRRVGSRRAWT
jgi:4-amino-4-deoxy-L-arabinose transferase-like glycosyltransferase